MRSRRLRIWLFISYIRRRAGFDRNGTVGTTADLDFHFFRLNGLSKLVATDGLKLTRHLAEHRSHWLRLAGICACVLLMGCNRNPYLASTPASYNLGQQQAALQQQQAAAAPQVAELERRVRLLDDNNRQLTTQLAQSQQMVQVARERSELLARQLLDVNGQLDQSKFAQNQSAQKLQGIQASMQSRGSAVLTANNSLSRQLEDLQSMGVPAKLEGDIIRMSIPADQLFAPGTSQLGPSAAVILDKAAEAITKVFSRHRVAVEGHTDNGPINGGAFNSLYQMAGAQSQAVMDSLMRRNGIPSGQLFSIAHGPNHPIAENQTPLGRAQNRRVDLVVYPDTF